MTQQNERRPQINIVALRNITYRMVYGILQHMAAGFHSATI